MTCHRSTTKKFRRGFSMVEVALALGVVAFAFLTLLALLPAGVKTNRSSVEETRATFILTNLEADLRNSLPVANNGKSILFGLQLPYSTDSDTGARTFNHTITTPVTTPVTTLTNGVTTTGLKESEEPEALNATTRSLYQVSVIYTMIPPVGNLQVARARLIVNWPSITTNNPADLTDWGKVSGFVETTVSFPAP